MNNELERYLNIGIQEHNLPWSGPGPTEALCAVFQRAAWAPFTTMEFEVGEEAPYNLPKLVRRLTRKDALVSLFTPNEDQGAATLIPYGSIARHPLQNTVVFHVPESSWRGPEPVIQFMADVARLMPEFTFANANADMGIRSFCVDLDLKPLPKCFNSDLVWLHLLSPKNYSPHFERADLLGAPAHEVREFEDGLISIMAFENPFAYDTPENRERQLELHRYFYERKKL